MSIAELARKMRQLGAPPEAVELAIEAIEAEQAKLLARRARDAERKARQRSRDSHGTVTGHVTPSPPPQEKVPPHPPKTQPLTPKHQEGNGRATAFPIGFEPNETDRRVAEEVGCLDLAAEIDHWRDHHIAKGSVFKDWHAALRTWLRSPLRTQKPARGPPFDARSQQRSLALVNGNSHHVQASSGKRTLGQELAERKARNPYFAGRG